MKKSQLIISILTSIIAMNTLTACNSGGSLNENELKSTNNGYTVKVDSVDNNVSSTSSSLLGNYFSEWFASKHFWCGWFSIPIGLEVSYDATNQTYIAIDKAKYDAAVHWCNNNPKELKSLLGYPIIYKTPEEFVRQHTMRFEVTPNDDLYDNDGVLLTPIVNSVLEDDSSDSINLSPTFQHAFEVVHSGEKGGISSSAILKVNNKETITNVEIIINSGQPFYRIENGEFLPFSAVYYSHGNTGRAQGLHLISQFAELKSQNLTAQEYIEEYFINEVEKNKQSQFKELLVIIAKNNQKSNEEKTKKVDKYDALQAVDYEYIFNKLKKYATLKNAAISYKNGGGIWSNEKNLLGYQGAVKKALEFAVADLSNEISVNNITTSFYQQGLNNSNDQQEFNNLLIKLGSTAKTNLKYTKKINK